MDLKPYYQVLVDFGDGEIANGCDPSNFGDACDAYADHRDNGYEAGVFYVEPGTKRSAGAMMEVTADADDRISNYLHQRNDDLPEWLGGEPEATIIAEDIAHARQESCPDLFV